MKITVHITPNDKGNPPGKLADAELWFIDNLAPRDASDKPHDDGIILDGLKLIGFSIWERRGGTGRNVTFPARSYAVNGERRSFALLRPRTDTASQNGIRQLILDAYEDYEQRSGSDGTLDENERREVRPTDYR